MELYNKFTSKYLKIQYELEFCKGKLFLFIYDTGNSDNASLSNNINFVISNLKLKSIHGINHAIILLRDREGCFEQVVCTDKGNQIISLDGALDFNEALEISERKTPFLYL